MKKKRLKARIEALQTELRFLQSTEQSKVHRQKKEIGRLNEVMAVRKKYTDTIQARVYALEALKGETSRLIEEERRKPGNAARAEMLEIKRQVETLTRQARTAIANLQTAEEVNANQAREIRRLKVFEPEGQRGPKIPGVYIPTIDPQKILDEGGMVVMHEKPPATEATEGTLPCGCDEIGGCICYTRR